MWSNNQKIIYQYLDKLKYTHIRTFSSTHQDKNSRLIDKHGQLHETAQEIFKTNKDTELENIIKEFLIFSGPLQAKPNPIIYQDVIVFYNQDKVVGSIHLCLEGGCIELKNRSFKLELSLTTFGSKNLTTLFRFLGHLPDIGDNYFEPLHFESYPEEDFSDEEY